MGRAGAVTFKGNPLTLAGEAVQVGQAAPDFTLHAFAAGALQTLKLADVKGKPTFISVVPSLDTPVCATQTKKFNEELNALDGKINALTVSLDLPFAMNRFCGAESIKNMRAFSDYQDRNFGQKWGRRSSKENDEGLSTNDEGMPKHECLKNVRSSSIRHSSLDIRNWLEFTSTNSPQCSSNGW
ncbi:MAG: thiol peroxidase [Planctomycetia bacterium]|nr:thiol peroxidase [Planctomycetia bacterium]